MKIIENLISRYCPDGVEYVDLVEVVVFTDGHSFSSGSFTESGEYQVVKITDIFGGLVNRGKTFINELPEKLKNGQQLSGGEILVAMSGSTGKTGYNTLSNAVVNQRIAILRNQDCIENGYLKYLLVNGTFETYCFKNGTGPQNNISKAQLLRYRIPLPPLPIQQEIVRILDTFTNLTAELTNKLNAELTARRKQYEYYRDELLKTGEQVSLYEVAQYSKDRILASELTDENYVGVDNLLPNKQGKIKSEHTPIEGKFTGFVKGDILIGNIRPYLKKIWFSDCVGGTNGDVLTIRVIDKERVLPRFLYFALSTESFFNYDMNNAKGAKMPRGDKNAVMKYQFYLPSLEIQEQVVSILEIFDNLCNGLECGLPAEIYARQQQYEYYRDKLLNFKELHNKED